MSAAVACTQCGALTAKQCTCQPDFSFRKLGEENIQFQPEPAHLYQKMLDDQAARRRAERLEVASRVLAGILANPTITYTGKEPATVGVAKSALEFADALIAAVDAKP
jgi:hypothetical protein